MIKSVSQLLLWVVEVLPFTIKKDRLIYRVLVIKVYDFLKKINEYSLFDI